jgi:hypothetical protein
MEPENLQLEISWYSYLESLLNGQEQILSFQQVSPVTSMIFVDAVKHTLAPGQLLSQHVRLQQR